jgi:hypothetical protein
MVTPGKTGRRCQVLKSERYWAALMTETQLSECRRKYYAQIGSLSRRNATRQDISHFQEDSDLMSKPQDGFVSRFLNRPISHRITAFLLKFPIHPNGWTVSIFVLPLIAGTFLMRGDYSSVVIGAAIFQVFSILDGCDERNRAVSKIWNRSLGND